MDSSAESKSIFLNYKINIDIKEGFFLSWCILHTIVFFVFFFYIMHEWTCFFFCFFLSISSLWIFGGDINIVIISSQWLAPRIWSLLKAYLSSAVKNRCKNRLSNESRSCPKSMIRDERRKREKQKRRITKGTRRSVKPVGHFVIVHRIGKIS